MRTLLYGVFGLAPLSLLAAGCSRGSAQGPGAAPLVVKPAVVIKKAPDTPMENKREELGGKTWNPVWDAMIEEDLPSSLLSAKAGRAVRSYCPRFEHLSEADKRAFWAYTFQAIAGAEASLDPTANVHHLEAPVNVTDKETGRPSRQQGLLQLKYEDDQRYGCNFDWARDRRLPIRDESRTILDPARNLSCGVKIMENQIVSQGKSLVTRTSYWATLKPGTAGFSNFSRQMANVPAACGEGALKSSSRKKARHAANHEGGREVASR